MVQTLRSPELLHADTGTASEPGSVRSTHSAMKKSNKTTTFFPSVMGWICSSYRVPGRALFAHAKASAEQSVADERGCTQQPRSALSVGSQKASRTGADLTAHRMGGVLQRANHRSRTRGHRTIAGRITSAVPSTVQLIRLGPPSLGDASLNSTAHPLPMRTS